MQKEYQWLLKEEGPKMIVQAIKLYGTKEVEGKGNNNEIMKWAEETGLAAVYTGDEVPWCGLFMSLVAMRAGKVIPQGPLWALNWQHFGVKANTAMLGDVIAFKMKIGGHVGLCVGEDAVAYHILGGNQQNAVTIARFNKNLAYAIRRPVYINQPANVRKIMLTPRGPLAHNTR